MTARQVLNLLKKSPIQEAEIKYNQLYVRAEIRRWQTAYTEYKIRDNVNTYQGAELSHAMSEHQRMLYSQKFNAEDAAVKLGSWANEMLFAYPTQKAEPIDYHFTYLLVKDTAALLEVPFELVIQNSSLPRDYPMDYFSALTTNPFATKELEHSSQHVITGETFNPLRHQLYDTMEELRLKLLHAGRGESIDKAQLHAVLDKQLAYCEQMGRTVKRHAEEFAKLSTESSVFFAHIRRKDS